MTFDEKLKAVLDHLRTLPPSRSASLAITKLEECALWASCAANGVASPIDWVTGTNVPTPPKRTAVLVPRPGEPFTSFAERLVASAPAEGMFNGRMMRAAPGESTSLVADRWARAFEGKAS